MKDTYYKKLENPLGVATIDLIRDYSLTGWIITRIFVPERHRGKGVATALLNEVLAEADKEKTTLWLEVEAGDGLSEDELIKWYERHGFIESSVVYERKPL